jgi:hypothetical protein
MEHDGADSDGSPMEGVHLLMGAGPEGDVEADVIDGLLTIAQKGASNRCDKRPTASDHCATVDRDANQSIPHKLTIHGVA